MFDMHLISKMALNVFAAYFFICASLAQEGKKSYGEPTADIIARLKANVVKEKSGDVFIKPYERSNSSPNPVTYPIFAAFYAYIDADFDGERFAEYSGLSAGTLLNWGESLSLFGKYFKGKDIELKTITPSDKNLIAYLEKGVPITFFIDVNPIAFEEFAEYIKTRTEKRAEFTDIKKWREELDKDKAISKKLLSKVSKEKGGGANQVFITGYNAQSKEYQCYFAIGRHLKNTCWITKAELDAFEIKKGDDYTFRSFDFKEAKKR